jgi:hypothetical protein
MRVRRLLDCVYVVLKTLVVGVILCTLDKSLEMNLGSASKKGFRWRNCRGSAVIGSGGCKRSGVAFATDRS